MNALLRKMRVALTPRNRLLKTTLANGAVVYGRNRPGYGGRGIYIFRDAIEPEFEHLEKFVEPSGVFVDIGANTGIYTMKAAKQMDPTRGVVLAIEPFPEMLAMLHHNVQANGFKHVRLRNFCVGESTRATKLWLNFNKPNSFGLIRRDKDAPFLSTLTVALDELFVWEGLERLDYLKIDAEGAEEQILLGAKKIIARCRPIILMEVNINDVFMKLENYSVFQAKGMNKLWIPNESPKSGLPEKLGWRVLAHGHQAA